MWHLKNSIPFLIILFSFSFNAMASRIRVIIDPGHGGVDGGASTGATKESMLVLSIAKLIQQTIDSDLNLSAQIDLQLTRQIDTSLSLTQRVLPLFEEKPDLFISLHANSSVSNRSSGMEVYFDSSDSLTKKSNSNQTLYDNKSDNKIVNQIISEISEFGRVKQSQLFAETLRELWTISPSTIRRAPFFVLDNNQAPAVLIETGFMTNKSEFSNLSTPSHQKIIADKIVKSLLTYKQLLTLK